MDTTAIIALCAALSVTISVIFASLAQSKFTVAAMDAIGRQPETAKEVKSGMLLPMALMEALAIYGTVVALMLVTKI